jgi:hypothetical protein
MAGVLLAFPRFGEKAMHVVPPRGGQFILDAPDFLEDQVAAALHRWFFD